MFCGLVLNAKVCNNYDIYKNEFVFGMRHSDFRGRNGSRCNQKKRDSKEGFFQIAFLFIAQLELRNLDYESYIKERLESY